MKATRILLKEKKEIYSKYIKRAWNQKLTVYLQNLVKFSRFGRVKERDCRD